MSDQPQEQTITVPLSEYTNLFNLAMMMQGKEQILAMAARRLQAAEALPPVAPAADRPKLVKGKTDVSDG